MVPLKTKMALIVSAVIALIAAAGVISGVILIYSRLIRTLEKEFPLSGFSDSPQVSEQFSTLKLNMEAAAETLKTTEHADLQRTLLKIGIANKLESLTMIGMDGAVHSYGACVFNRDDGKSDYLRRAFQGETVMSSRPGENGKAVIRIVEPVDNGRALVAVFPIPQSRYERLWFAREPVDPVSRLFRGFLVFLGLFAAANLAVSICSFRMAFKRR